MSNIFYLNSRIFFLISFKIHYLFFLLSLATKPLQLTYSTKACVSFYYHMLGSGMGTLSVHAYETKPMMGSVQVTRKTLWSQSGPNGDHWHYVGLNYDKPATLLAVQVKIKSFEL